MSIFPNAEHLASWAGQCPGNDQSAGKRRSGRTRKGSKWLDWALEESALAAVRSKDTYLAAQYQRLRPRCVIWQVLSTGEIYGDLGGDYFHKRDSERSIKRLVAQLEALARTVTLQEEVTA